MHDEIFHFEIFKNFMKFYITSCNKHT